MPPTAASGYGARASMALKARGRKESSQAAGVARDASPDTLPPFFGAVSDKEWFFLKWMRTMDGGGPTMPAQISPDLRSQIEQGYEEYVASRKRTSGVSNEPLRDAGQTFADAMCEGPIAEGLDNGQEILDIIKKSGRPR